MKKFTYSFSFIAFLSFLLFVGGKVQAQTQSMIYYQNFDSSANIPTGWISAFNGVPVTNLDDSTNGWYVDVVKSDTSNGYTLFNGWAASGRNNIVVKNIFNPGNYELVTCNIDAYQDSSLQVDWGARISNNFYAKNGYINGLYFSVDGGATWDSVTYTEGTANSSAWILENNNTPINLPAKCNHQRNLRFSITGEIYGGTSGTYRIDDFYVSGVNDPTYGTGVDNLTGDIFSAYAYASGNSDIVVGLRNMDEKKYTMELINMLGETVKKQLMNASSLVVNSSDLATGVYMVRVSNGITSTVIKVPVSK